MKMRLVIVWYFVLIVLMVALPRATYGQSDAEAGDAYLPLIFGDNAFSMLYPADWIFDDEPQDSFNFASREALLDGSPEQVFETGDVRVSLRLIPSSSAYDVDTPLLTTFAQVISRTLLEQLDGEFPPSLFPSLPEIIPGADGAVEVARLVLDFGEAASGRMYFWKLTDHVYGLMNVTTAAGESDDPELAILTMIQSATLTIDYTVETLADSSGQ